MGFGAIAANIIMFIAVIMIAGTFVVFVNMYIQDTSSSLKVQKDRLVDELKTDITVTSVSFLNTSNPHTTSVYVKNTGKTKLELGQTDIYIDGTRYERSQISISVENDTAVGNALIWDPREIIKIQVMDNLSNTIHTARVVTGNGASDEETFSG